VLVEHHPDVARLAGAPDTFLAAVKAATLTAPGDVMASHSTAVAMWSGPPATATSIHLLSAEHDRRFSVRGAIVHRPRDLLDLRPVIRSAIAVTNPVRTLCDVGAIDASAVEPALVSMMVAGYVRPDTMWAAVDRHAAKGRPGIPALRDALARLALGSKPPDSVLEPAMSRLLQRHGLPPATFHPIVAGYEVDFRVDHTQVVIETDGWSTHGLDREQFERDREKDAVLRELGYVVCRFTWRQVVARPAWTAQRLRETLQRWAPGVLPAA
jgi:very-short-patch-repair endonuclease